jgi:hypothetical protein
VAHSIQCRHCKNWIITLDKCPWCALADALAEADELRANLNEALHERDGLLRSLDEQQQWLDRTIIRARDAEAKAQRTDELRVTDLPPEVGEETG